MEFSVTLMSRLVLTILLVFLIGFHGEVARAQTAPDIARGTLSEEVIRAYGWPNGKSTSESREVWLYDEFQVAFEKGRVVNVWSIPPDKRQPKRRDPLPVGVRRPTNSSAPNIPLTRTSQLPGSPTVSPVSPTPTAQLEPVPIDRQNDRKLPVRSSGIALFDLWPLLAIGCLATILAVATAERRRIRREVEEITRTPPGSSSPVQKSWQESVAESVARAAQDTTTHSNPNPVAPSPATNVSIPTPAAEPPLVLTELSYELLDRLEWKRVELIVALYFAQTGVRAECTCIGADGGVDVQLYRTGELTPFCYVQCKALGAKVDVKLVRELLGVMSSAKVAEGVFVTTGRYTKDALNFAAKNNIQAISGVGFVDRFNQLPRDSRVLVLSKVTEGDYTTPTCSQCDIKMVLREVQPPQWRCRRCNNRQFVRKSRWSALRSVKR